MQPITRSLLGLAAGLLTVFLIDYFVWPGTLIHGAIGVITAVLVLALLGPRKSGA